MEMREGDLGPTPGINTISLGETFIHRHSRPALMKPSFNWNAPDKYVELLTFEMEVANILQIKT